MDIRFLKSLIAVVENGSISAAARSEGLTATAISQRIRALEIEFGADLLVRSGHSATPSKVCLALLPKARKLVQDAANLKREISGSTLVGPFRIGAIETVLFERIPALVKTIAQKAPGCDLTVKPGTSKQLFEMIKTDQIDLAVIVAPSFDISKEIHVEVLEQQPFVLIQSAEKGPPTAIDLKHQPFILYDRDSWGGVEAWKWLAKNGAPENILCELDAMSTIVSMVKNGLGVSLLPKWSALSDDQEGLAMTTPTPAIKQRQLLLICKDAVKNEPLFQLIRTNFSGSQ